MGKTSDLDPNTHRFGLLVRELRNVRGLTQEQLAEKSGLAADTIRRAEHGSFSSMYSRRATPAMVASLSADCEVTGYLGPQSAQPVPNSHTSNSEPGPPSPQTPSAAHGHVSMHFSHALVALGLQ